MKRPIVLFFVFALVLVLLAGCGSSDGGDASCADILSYVKDNVSDGFDVVYSYNDSKYQDNFSFMYGITWDMIADGGIIYTEKGGLADEISIVRLKDQADVKIAKDKFTDRLEERKNQFGGYKPEEVYKLDNAMIMVQGNYVALIIGEDPASLEVLIRNAIAETAAE